MLVYLAISDRLNSLTSGNRRALVPLATVWYGALSAWARTRRTISCKSSFLSRGPSHCGIVIKTAASWSQFGFDAALADFARESDHGGATRWPRPRLWLRSWSLSRWCDR